MVDPIRAAMRIRLQNEKEARELESAHGISEARIFGSRALGNFKNGSDIDIALFGPEADEESVSWLLKTAGTRS